MIKQELEFKIVSVKRSIATKKKELQEEQNYLKYLERALQEQLRGDQMDMFDDTSIYHDLLVNEIDVMHELNG
jgi:hypothetical protein